MFEVIKRPKIGMPNSGFLLILCLIFSYVDAFATAEPVSAIFKKRYTEFNVQSDGAYSQSIELSIQVLNLAAVEKFSALQFPFFEKTQSVRFIEAEIIKRDGKKVRILEGIVKPATQLTPQGPIFPNRKELRIIFPDLQIGDTIYCKIRGDTSQPLFSNHFAVAQYFPNTVQWEDARVSIKVPSNLKLKIRTAGMIEQSTAVSSDYKMWTWVLERNKNNSDMLHMSQVPLVQVSTFSNYEDLAVAYDQQARNRSLVSTKIQTLANDLTKGVVNKREQVKILYEWVKKNILYRAVYLGADAAFVPEYAEKVLLNRFGDCKDHVALLEALLKAKNITSTAVLINTGQPTALPDIVSPESFNHAITYVPDLAMYLDTTLALATFENLPSEDRGRPALHIIGLNKILYTPR